jgi:predicted ATP-binding protein involved in virulence
MTNQCFISALTLRNYRCFQEFTVTFHERLTVFVAPNGGGKTAILDGIAVALRLFVDTVEGRTNSKGFDTRDIRLVLTPDNKMEPVTPVRLDASGTILGTEVLWARQRQSVATSRTTTAEAALLKQIAASLAQQNQEWAQGNRAEAPLFPLMSYYGTGRLWSSSKLTEGKKTREPAPNARHRGYTDCLSSASHYKYFVDWFRRFSYEERKLIPEQGDSPHEPSRTLSAVRTAVDIALSPSGWHGLEWDFAEDTIVARHADFGRLPVDTLSDGIRNMIGLVADIAHRMARLNPHMGERAAIETPGIVLIDEVDMHLHPQWQQVVLRSVEQAFPLLQLIVTTHSPQVLTTVRKENIRLFSCDEQGNWTASEPTASPLAHESGDALAQIMGTHPRPEIQEILPDLHAYEQLARAGRGDSDEARELQKRLAESGFEFSAAERALFEFLSKKTPEADRR